MEPLDEVIADGFGHTSPSRFMQALDFRVTTDLHAAGFISFQRQWRGTLPECI
jgi:hypothetical protein